MIKKSKIVSPKYKKERTMKVEKNHNGRSIFSVILLSVCICVLIVSGCTPQAATETPVAEVPVAETPVAETTAVTDVAATEAPVAGECKPDWDKFKTDFTKFTQTQLNFWKGIPTDEYHFLFQILLGIPNLFPYNCQNFQKHMYHLVF